MARLIRTEKEVEGRYEDVWLVVEEDALDQWPEGPQEVVGRPAQKVDGYERARGEARFTSDVLLPGMLHTALLRSPHAHAVIDFPGKQPQRQADHARALRQHALDGEMGLASIGRAENGRCGRTGGHGDWEIAVPLT